MTKLQEIVGALKAMPPLPHVALRVLEVVRDPEYSIDELVALVRTDPSLTARILKLCNSALYGMHREVGTVADAVAYLGTRNLVKLVLVSCSSTHFGRTHSSPYADAEMLWRHTFGIATASQWLATRCGYAQADLAFTAGILHNIGKVVLSQTIDAATFPTAPTGASHSAVEETLFGIDHAAAAGIVVDTWGLPRELRRAVRSHHDPEQLAGDSPLPAILNLADTLTLRDGIGNPFPSLPLATDPAVLNRLHLQPEDLQSASAHVARELMRNADLLNLDSLLGR
jgi:HD-like signal output (HDOD) protein